MMPEASSVYSSKVPVLLDPDGIADVFVIFSINVLSRRDKRGRIRAARAPRTPKSG